MVWEEEIEDFKEHLTLERGLQPNSVKAYITDISKFVTYLKSISPDGTPMGPEEVDVETLHGFWTWLGENGISPRTQARIMSGIKSFFHILLFMERIEDDPTEMFQTPKIGRKLPTVLSVEEIDAMEASFDTTKVEGVRNLAIVETLYSCGLRVSELTEAKLSDLHMEEGYVRVIGKGQKERLVPIGESAKRCIADYVGNWRSTVEVQAGSEDVLFLNRFGYKLSRIMVFNIIKEAARAAGITKVVSPHTLRHSFATHLVDGGANLRAVQSMLGHESITTTEVYTHLDSTYLRSTLVINHPYKGDGDGGGEKS